MKYEFRLLGKDLDRAAFSCGEPALDVYLAKQAMQDMRKRMAVCYALVERGNPLIIGYYTLSTASVVLAELPAHLTKKLPRYPYVPAVLLGRLAVNAQFQGQGIGDVLLGDVLLGDALLRILALSDSVAVHMVIVDALHEKAAGFYERRDFQRFPDQSLRLFLPVAKIRDIFPEEPGAPSAGGALAGN